jgi:phage major head subunit gpT-like protein
MKLFSFFTILADFALNMFLGMCGVMFLYNSPTMLLKGIQARFLRGLATVAASMMAPLIEMTTSESNKETYVLFNHFGVIKEWIDEVEFSHLEDFDFEIKNKDWQNGFLVDRNTLDDSKKTLGNDVEREITFSLSSWGNFPDKLITELLVAGESGLAFDGVAFFAASRPKLQYKGTTINNIVTGTGVDTLAHITADLASAMSYLRAMKAKNGDPFNYNPKYLAIIPSHVESFFATLRDSIEISGSTNIYKGKFDYIVNDYLSTSANSWYLFNASTPFKAFIYQTRKAPMFDMTDDKKKKFIQYFSTGRMNAGYGNPLSIIKVKNS